MSTFNDKPDRQKQPLSRSGINYLSRAKEESAESAQPGPERQAGTSV